MMLKSRWPILLALACLLVFFLPTTTSAQSGDFPLEAFGAVVDDGKDDAPALQAALDALASKGGGRVVFPAGQVDILTPVRKDFLGTSGTVTLTGRISATRVHVAVGGGKTAIFLSNAQSVLVEKLVFNGTQAFANWEPQFFDADHVLMFGSCLRVVVRDCDFYGVAASTGIITSFGSDLHLTDSSLRGCHAAGAGLVYSYDWRGLTVERSDFIDYGTLNGTYYTKSTAHPPAWVFTGAPAPSAGPGDERRISVIDVRLDEGAARGVHIEGGADLVSIKGLSCNLNSASTGVGVWLTGVRRAKIEQSWLGFTLQNRPGVKLVNCDIVELESVKFGEGVSHVWTTNDTTWLILRYCDFPQRPEYPQGVRNEGGTRIEVVEHKPLAEAAPPAESFKSDAFADAFPTREPPSPSAFSDPSGLVGDFPLEAFGAVADDGKDDAPALQAALNALASRGGGRVIFPVGRTDLFTPVRGEFLTAASSVTFTSAGAGTRVHVAVGGGQIAIFLANAETILVEKLIFHGTAAPASTYDADHVFMFGSSLRVTVRDSHFYGLAASNGVLTSLSSDLHITDSSFRGCHAAGGGVLFIHDWRGLTAERVNFLTEGVLDGTVYSKASASTPAWIASWLPKPLISANSQRRIVLEDVRMEEGAARCLYVAYGVEFVDIEGLTCDANSGADGAGIWLVGAGHAKIRRSRFSSPSAADRPGLKITDSDIVELEDVSFGNGVSHVWTTGIANWLTLRYCDIPADQRYPQGVRNEGGTRVEVIARRPVSSVQFSAPTFSATEGEPAAVVTATRTGDTYEAATFDYATADGTASSPSDYARAYRAARFAAGETQTSFKINLADDGFYEGQETVNLALSNPTDGATLGGPSAAVLNLKDNEPLPSFSIGDVTVVEAAGGAAVAAFQIKLSVPTVFVAKVDYATANGTAAAGSDYTAASGSLTFAPGETAKTVSVQVRDDALDEADETFFVNLSGAANASVADAQAVATVKDDDNPPSISIKGGSVAEGDSGTAAATFAVSLSAPSGQSVTVNYATADGTAAAGSDYTAASGSLTFAPGETSKTVTVLFNGDAVGEANETLFIRLTSPTNATVGVAEVQVTIIDDEEGTLQFSSAAYRFGEGDGSVLIVVTRVNGSAGSVSVNYATADGTAKAGSDYTSASGSLSFAPGETSKSFTLRLLEDAINEGDETHGLALSTPTGGAVLGTAATAQLTIVDNDPTPALSLGDLRVTEGNAGNTNATFTVTLSNPSSRNVTVSFATVGGTATAGSDYAAASGSLTFAPGDLSKTITIQVAGDTVGEADETFFLDLSGAANATIARARGVCTIADDEVGVLQFTAASFGGAEDKGAITVTVARVNGSAGSVSVNYATADGTAKAGADYTSASGTLSFAPGETGKTLTVKLLDDAQHEGDETAAITLSAPTGGATLGTQAAAALTVVENEAFPSLSVAPASGVEGATDAAFTVTLSPASSQPVTVNYATADGTAKAGSDYTSASGTLTFAPGETGKTFNVRILDDSLYEGEETAAVSLSGLVGRATLGGASSAALTIRDNEQPPVVNVSGSVVNERGGPGASFTVTMAPASSKPVTVDYATADGTAKAGSDYTSASGTLTFAPGETSKTFNVTVIDDKIFEGTETAGVRLSRATGGASLGGAPDGTLTIEDDEGTPAFSVSDPVFLEGDDRDSSAVFEVRLTNASTRVITVNYATADGTAKAGSDYTSASGSLTFAPGETTRSVTVNVKGDLLDEADETFTLNLSNPSEATADDPQGVCTINDDDASPALSIDDVTVQEGNGGTASVAAFTVTLSAASARPVTISYATADGTAAAGSDYTSASGTLTFAPGETSKTFMVLIGGDLKNEADETFFVNLSGAANATTADAQAAGTIVNDDTPTVQFAQAVFPATESGRFVTITVTRGGDPSSVFAVNYETADADGSERSDYTTALGTLRFAAGETAKSFDVLLTDDGHQEGNESLSLILSNPTDGAVLGAFSTAVVALSDDDASPSQFNPIDGTRNFVRQHYLDFLNREPDADGLTHWTGVIESCGTDAQCREVRRIDVSAAFFLSIEFQNTGYFTHRLYSASFARPARYREFLRDTQEVGRGITVGRGEWQRLLEERKQALVEEWVRRPEFRAAFDGLTDDQYVFTLYQNAGVATTPDERAALVAGLGTGAETRASALRRVVESGAVLNRQYNPAFVLMQYFGYLRRNPDDAPNTDLSGYNFWLGNLDKASRPGEDMRDESAALARIRRAELIKAFISSTEYRERFGR